MQTNQPNTSFVSSNFFAVICNVNRDKISDYMEKTGIRYNPKPKHGETKFPLVVADNVEGIPVLDSLEDLVMKGYMIIRHGQ